MNEPPPPPKPPQRPWHEKPRGPLAKSEYDGYDARIGRTPGKPKKLFL